jgi:predicted DCC family thiol-disulfide oxidoreductase YuxK
MFSCDKLQSPKENTMELTIFYDSTCPLCANEMRQLKRHDKHDEIHLEDLYSADLHERFPQIDIEKANIILHGLTKDGQLLLGLDVTAKAWGITGKHFWVQWLRKPFIKPVADQAYLFFAKNRYKISYLLTGKQRCNNGQCGLPKNNLK